MFDDYIERFRSRNEISQSQKYNDIIAQSLSKIDVYLNGALNAIPVSFINNDKEAADEAVMYTYSKDGVKIGDYINFLDSDYLVYKEVKNLKREGFISLFKLILCNTSFTFAGQTIKCYFKGSLRSTASQEGNLSQNFGVSSYGEALIMIPDSISFKVNSIVSINNKGWRSTYIDNTTNPGTKYIIIEEYALIDISSTPVQEPILMNILDLELPAGITQTFTTEGSFIKTDKQINIIKRTLNSIEFIIPFGTENITISTKENNQVVSQYYKVRG